METLKIQSVEANIPQVEAFVEGICTDLNCYNYFGTISVAVLQAVENAIVHGNKRNPEKSVTIKFSRAKGGVSFTVEDEGKGFDYKSYTDLPTDTEQGTGIFLMNVLSDNCQFSNKGRCVKMLFKIQGIDAGYSMERANTLTSFFQKATVKI
jgi:serine/threonine-protein kinase RsbW